MSRVLRDDLEKHAIPAGATDGSVLWLRLENVPVMGRLAVITRHGGMASSYDCCLCGCPGQYDYTLLIPVITCPITVALGNQVHGQVWYSPPCGGTYYYFDMTTSLGWSSTDTSVFTLNNSNPKGLLTGVGVGSATALAQGTTACQAWYMMGTVCQCSSWVTIVGNTPCSVCNLSISSPANGQVFSLGGSNYNSATIPLDATSACPGTANWTLLFDYTTKSGALYSDTKNTSSTTNSTLGYNTSVGDGGEVALTASATLAGDIFSVNYTVYVDGTPIPPATITNRLLGLYSGTTTGLLTGIAMAESSYHQFVSRSLYQVPNGLWPNEGPTGGSVGLMMAPNCLLNAFDWMTNTSQGLSIFNSKYSTVQSYVSGQRSGNSALPDLSATQYEDNQLLLYGGWWTSNSDYYWVPNSAYTGWVKNTGSPGYSYVNNVRNNIQ